MAALALASCAKLRDAEPQDAVDDRQDLIESDEPAEERPDLDLPDDTARVFDDPVPLGSAVTVTGMVDEVVDQNAFEIVSPDRRAPGFLVLVADPGVRFGEMVRVTGTVRRSDFDALAAELDFPLDEDLYSPVDRQQVIVADSVEVVGSQPPERPSGAG